MSPALPEYGDGVVVARSEDVLPPGGHARDPVVVVDLRLWLRRRVAVEVIDLEDAFRVLHALIREESVKAATDEVVHERELEWEELLLRQVGQLDILKIIIQAWKRIFLKLLNRYVFQEILIRILYRDTVVTSMFLYL